MDRQLPVWASFALVAVISVLLLVSTHLVTQVFAPPEGAIGKDSAQGEALPAAELFVPVVLAADTGLDNCYKAQAGGQAVGYAAQVTVNGYGGPIELVVGMDMSGALTGISVDGAQFNETPGLGAKSKEPEFKNQFVGIQTPVGFGTSDSTSSASIEWTATPAPAADGTSSATQSGEWTATPAPASDAASLQNDAATVAVVPAADATSSATQSGEWAATAAPAADATSAATQSGEWATEAPTADATPAPETAAASTIDAISGATITSKAIVGGVNLCADFIKSLLAGGNA